MLSTSVQLMVFPFVSMMAFVVLWLVFGIALCIWVYRDAEFRGMEGTIWLLIVLFTGPIGFIIYLVVRDAPRSRRPPPRRSERFCSHCGSRAPVDGRFCPNCGQTLRP